MVLLTLPKNIKLNIKKGDTAVAGETIIATFNISNTDLCDYDIPK
jgi:hypothetical protein